MDRVDWYFRQLVTEGEMDFAFDQVQDRIEQAASQAETGFDGVITGAFPGEASPPDLTVDVSAPALAYTPEGKRLQWDLVANLDLSEDDFGVSTEITTPGNARWISVFVEFDEAFDDLRTDGFGAPVYWKRLASHRLFVVMSDEAVTPVPPPLRPDALLLADFYRVYGQTTIENSDRVTTRRQNWYRNTGNFRSDIWGGRARDVISDLHDDFNLFASDLDYSDAYPAGASLVGISAYTRDAGGEYLGWATGRPIEVALRNVVFQLCDVSGAERVGFTPVYWLPYTSENVQSAVQDLIEGLDTFDLPNPGASRIGMQEIDVEPTGLETNNFFLDNEYLQWNLESLLDQLTENTGGANSGAARIGAGSVTGSIVSMPSPASLSQGSIYHQLHQLIDYIETIRNTPFTASAVTFTPHDYVTSTNVQSAINELIDDLQSTATGAGSGSYEIGWKGRASGGIDQTAPNFVYASGPLESGLERIMDEIQKRAGLSGGLSTIFADDAVYFGDYNFFIDPNGLTTPQIVFDGDSPGTNEVRVEFDRTNERFDFYIRGHRKFRIAGTGDATWASIGGDSVLDGGLNIGVYEPTFGGPADGWIKIGGGTTTTYPPATIQAFASLGNYLDLNAGSALNGRTKMTMRAGDGTGLGDYHQIYWTLDSVIELFLDGTVLRPGSNFGLDLGTLSEKWSNVYANMLYARNTVTHPSSQTVLASRHASNLVLAWATITAAGSQGSPTYNIASVVKGTAGYYTINLDEAVNTGSPILVNGASNDDTTASAWWNSTTQIGVAIKDASSGGVVDRDFNIAVIGTPNTVTW